MTIDFIKDKMLIDDRWLERGILAIGKYQTASEVARCDTHLYNKRGFNGSDGHFMTSLFKILSKGYHLTEKQKFVAKKKMMKYAGQLLRIATKEQ